MSKLRLFGTLCMCVGLLCAVVATALNYWYYVEMKTPDGVSLGSVYFGLWRKCFHSDNPKMEESRCYTWSYIKEKIDSKVDIRWFQVCEAFMIIGVVCNFVALLAAACTVLKGVTEKIPRGFAIFSAIFLLVALVVFACKYREGVSPGQNNGRFHAGFDLTIVAIIVDVLGTVFIGVGQTTRGYSSL